MCAGDEGGDGGGGGGTGGRHGNHEPGRLHRGPGPRPHPGPRRHTGPYIALTFITLGFHTVGR